MGIKDNAFVHPNADIFNEMDGNIIKFIQQNKMTKSVNLFFKF